MKFIHTGDWHIGKIVNEFHMTEDQDYILSQLIKLLEEERPDALIIAGDIYDRSVAPVEAVELLDRIFCRITLDLKIPILAIAGNHDSPERVGFGSSLLYSKGLYIEGVLKKEVSKVVLEDEYGPVSFYLMPYADPAVVRELYEDKEIKCHEDAVRTLIDNINKNRDISERSVMIYHGFVVGGEEPETSESERPLSIGGTEYVKADNFSTFSYTALGHLHGPQRVGNDNIRYSGSLLKYSFTEVNHKKGVTIVNLDQEGKAEIEHRELIPKRDLRKIKGDLQELIKPEVYQGTNREDYINVILTDEGELIDPIGKLRAVYPNIMQLTRENSVKREEKTKTAPGEDFKMKSKLELFGDFYMGITGRELNEEKIKILSHIIEEVEKEE